jgi:excinuclease ABC subunit C
MTEVVYRRYKRLVDENQAFTALIIIDGERTIVSGTKKYDDLGLRGKIAIMV